MPLLSHKTAIEPTWLKRCKRAKVGGQFIKNPGSKDYQGFASPAPHPTDSFTRAKQKPQNHIMKWTPKSTNGCKFSPQIQESGIHSVKEKQKLVRKTLIFNSCSKRLFIVNVRKQFDTTPSCACASISQILFYQHS